MANHTNYHKGLLYLMHLLISADGVVDDREKTQLELVRNGEGVPDELYEEFKNEIKAKREREIYQRGIELINLCTDEEKLRVFTHLYKMSQVDGTVHVKEVRLLLYSLKMVSIEFDDVIKAATMN